jgi:hypothetical protein
MKHTKLVFLMLLLGFAVSAFGQSVALSGGTTGNEDCVAIGDLDISNTYTVEAWIYPTQLTGSTTDQTIYGFTVFFIII